jgi:hypothetical protein
MEKAEAKKRLEYLRGELQAQRISLEELHELQGLSKHIEPGDVELLEAAGVPENKPDTKKLAEELLETVRRGVEGQCNAWDALNKIENTLGIDAKENTFSDLACECIKPEDARDITVETVQELLETMLKGDDEDHDEEDDE